MNTVIKLFLSNVLLIVVFYSCVSNDKPAVVTDKVWTDTTTYPKQPFYSVTFFKLDSGVKTKTFYDGYTHEDSNVVTRVSHGYSFVGENGVPKTKQYKSYDLDSIQIKRLESFLVQQPCGEGLHADKACVPTYKNVFVFYNQQKQPIAQMHVCFTCELSVFNPYAEYMCDFDNKVNYRVLKVFTDSIIQADNKKL
jgi:hypothetical protein